MNGFGPRISELERRVANLLRMGTIATLDPVGDRVTVKIGRIVTAPIPWMTQRAGPDTTFWAPEEGEQVMVLSPSGDFNLGVALPSIYQTAFPAPASVNTQQVTKWADGSSLTYDRAAHLWHLDVPDTGAQVEITTGGKVTVTANGDVDVTAGGNINLVATGNVNLTGAAINLTGPVAASSTVTAQSDVKGNGISLDSHVHAGVETGALSRPGPNRPR